MTVFDLLANMGGIAGDFFLLLAVLGAALLVAWRLVNLFTRRRHKAPVLVVQWAYLGGTLSLVLVVSAAIAHYPGPFGAFLVKLTFPSAAGLLLLTVLLIAIAILLDGIGNRRRQAKRAVSTRVS